MQENLKNLLEQVQSLRREEDTVLYEDSEEKLHLLLYMSDLLEEARQDDGHVSFNPDDEEFRYTRLRDSLEQLDRLGYIKRLSFSIGGNGFFEITEKYDFKRWIEKEKEKIEKRIDENDGESKQKVLKKNQEDIISGLEDFCNFVEEDGFLAFWKGGTTNNSVKSHPEEIGRGQFMAYLTGRGAGYQVREAPSGEGYQDVVLIEVDGESILTQIFELKFLRYHNKERYEEGISQLKSYAEGQDVETLYYLIFQKGEYFKNKEFEEDDLKIVQRCVNIKQKAPTSE